MGLLDDKLNEIRTMRENESVELERAKPKPRYRVKNGKVVMRMAAVLAEPKPASNIRKVAAKLPTEKGEHVAGGRCPHCKGSGRYAWHLYETTEKCFRCHGKGVLNNRDIQFYTNRINNGGPVNRVLSA